MINICFHGIGSGEREREPGGEKYWMRRDVFLGVLDELQKHPDARISFDDGNASDIEEGLPALLERGLRATFFPLAGRLGDGDSLSAADLRWLREAGMDIGTHGWAHVPWRGLTAEERRRELVDARQALVEASGGPIEEAALPLGRYDRALLKHLRGEGYRRVYTSDRYPARPGEWLQPRHSVTRTDTVDSVRRILESRTGAADLRHRASSMFKRIR